MFAELDGEYQFEELPLRIDGNAVALCWGTASYDVVDDSGGIITSITLASPINSDTSWTELKGSDVDPRKKWLFHMIAEEIESWSHFQDQVSKEWEEFNYDRRHG